MISIFAPHAPLTAYEKTWQQVWAHFGVIPVLTEDKAEFLDRVQRTSRVVHIEDNYEVARRCCERGAQGVSS